MEREMEIHFGKLLDEGAHFVTFVEVRTQSPFFQRNTKALTPLSYAQFHEATIKRLG
ncbi:hypothetical protein Pcac1_g22492 [Phytophthora cactorum]|nr:hypothetical protein Pcac1_g22492 [Phytophthora cactorum]